MIKQIKKVTVLFFVAASMMAVSCSKDNNGESSKYANLIVGKWKQTNNDKITEFSKDGYVFEDGSRKAKYEVKKDRLLLYYKDDNGNFTEDDNDWIINTITYLTETHMTIHRVVKGEGEYDEATGTYGDWEKDYDFERVQ